MAASNGKSTAADPRCGELACSKPDIMRTIPAVTPSEICSVRRRPHLCCCPKTSTSDVATVGHELSGGIFKFLNVVGLP